MRRLLCGMLLAASLLKGAVPEACQTGADRFASGQYASAQENLWQCLDAGQASSEQAYQLAMTYRALRNYETGLRKTDSALTQAPNNVDLLFLAAYLHYRRNETKQSMLLTSKAYGIAPKDWRIHEMFALNYISFHMLEPARLSLYRQFRSIPAMRNCTINWLVFTSRWDLTWNPSVSRSRAWNLLRITRRCITTSLFLMRGAATASSL